MVFCTFIKERYGYSMNYKYKLADNVIMDLMGISEDDDVMVVMPEMGKSFIVNSTTGEILNLLRDSLTINDVIHCVSETYSVEKQAIENDVNNIVHSMHEKSILVCVN